MTDDSKYLRTYSINLTVKVREVNDKTMMKDLEKFKGALNYLVESHVINSVTCGTRFVFGNKEEKP